MRQACRQPKIFHIPVLPRFLQLERFQDHRSIEFFQLPWPFVQNRDSQCQQYIFESDRTLDRKFRAMAVWLRLS